MHVHLHLHVRTWSYVVNPVDNVCNHAVSSFIELVEDIFKIPGVKLFLNSHINQDPLAGPHLGAGGGGPSPPLGTLLPPLE